MHYTVPLKTAVGGKYEFPGEYIGQYGTYEAVKHIYSRTNALKHLLSDNGDLHVSKRYFTSDIEKGITSIRTEWRESHQINDDDTVIFFAPGNE